MSDFIAQGLALSAGSKTASALMPQGNGPIYRCMEIGDSEIQLLGDARNNVFGVADSTAQLAMASNGVLLPIRNGGVGGQPSPVVAARCIRDMQRHMPDIVGLGVGTNNFVIFGDTNGDADPFTTLAADIATIHAAAKAIGAFFYLRNMPPRAVTTADLAFVQQGNAIIAAYAAANTIPLIDVYALTNDPANPGHWLANYSSDGTHPIAPVSWLIAQKIWSVISPFLLSSARQTLPQQDAANLLFTPITLYGLPANTSVRDALFRNYRTFSQNGYSFAAPWWVGTAYTGNGTAPTVSATIAAASGVNGNLWSVSARPNGAGSIVIQSAQGGRAIDVSRYQGRRVRVSFKARATGFNVDNTNAYLAANNDVPISAWGLTFACKDNSGNTIGSLNVVDPLDSSSSLGQASTLSLRTQLLTFQNGSSPGGCYDFALCQFHFEMNVPAGAIELNPSFNISFLAGAVTPVTVGLAEFAVVDQGAADVALPYLPMQNTARPWMDITAATTLSTPQVLACGYYRLNAATAAFTLTLPAASSCRGQAWTGKKIDSSANAVTIARAGSDTIDGTTTAMLSAQYATLRLVSNGGGWDVV
ncbi:SGNH/GDSL hydrolase family protein [Novosphingobium sp.]|uniref:SGNH/GDSL hydrolase family protein n=1 Tax=Novosphingobium sp. TaxID=1874826 RepID=UPI003B52764C